MFEEIAVWRRVNPKVAVRYVGFRNLETTRIWIALGNYVWIDEEGRDVTADQLVGAQGALESFLNDLPGNGELWKPTISEAVALFIANNPEL